MAAPKQEDPSSFPRLKFTVRGKQGIQGYWAGEKIEKDEGFRSNSPNVMIWSADGSLLLSIEEDGIVIQESESGKTIQKIARPKVTSASFSPKNNYLVTWERNTAPHVDGVAPTSNLLLWKISTGEQVAGWFQKSLNLELWPVIQWTEDESLFARAVSSEVHFYDPSEPTKIVNKLSVPDIYQFSIAPGPSPFTVATFVKEKKSIPAQVKLWKYPSMEMSASKSFFKASDVDLFWNKLGTEMIIFTHTDVDNSGRSYYGETGLHFITSDGKFDSNLILKKEGPIAAVAWNPNGKFFAVTYGSMPSQTSIFDSKCQLVADLGTNPRNTLKWSPNGRLLMVGGFGNLKGEMDIWDYKRLKKLSTMQANCAVQIEWSPDSRYILTAVVSPRVQVDNGLKVWRYDGTLVYSEEFEKLYQVSWRPTPATQYPDRPPSPRVYHTAKVAEAETVSKPVGKYVPPHLQGRVSAVKKVVDDGPVKYKDGVAVSKTTGKVEPDLPPGYDPDEPRKKKPAKKSSAPPAKVVAAPVKSVKSSSPAPMDPQRKLKEISRKLQQIGDIKKLQEAGEELDERQLERLASEESLRAEMNALNLA